MAFLALTPLLSLNLVLTYSATRTMKAARQEPAKPIGSSFQEKIISVIFLLRLQHELLQLRRFDLQKETNDKMAFT